MIRGTTPTLRFFLPFSVDRLDVAYITMQQDGMDVIEKTLEDCDAEGSELSFRMTQDDTLKLEAGRMVEIQLRVRLKTGDALASEIMRAPASRILKDGVI